MGAERDQLHELIDELSDSELPAALADVRRHLIAQPGHAWPPAWFGSARGARADTAARVDDILAEGFGRSR